MAEIDDLNTTDASNTARFPEGQAASTVNNGARALEGLLARFHEDLGARKSSTGSANAYAFAAAQTIAAYYDGLIIGFDANFANTGAATLNVDGLGAKTIMKHTDENLVADDIEVGQKVLAVYDGTNFQLLSPVAGLATATNAGRIETADQTEQEAGSATDRAVVPGRQHFHDSAAKVWANFSVAGTITDDYNVDSITDTAVGDWTVNITTDFSSTNYAAFSSGRADSSTNNVAWGITTLAAGSYRVHSVVEGGAEIDPASGNVWTVAFGDL